MIKKAESSDPAFSVQTHSQKLTGTINASFTRGINSEGNGSQQAIKESVLRFGTHNLVRTVTYSSCINRFALTQTRDKKVMRHLFGRRCRSARMNRETLLGTTRHH